MVSRIETKVGIRDQIINSQAEVHGVSPGRAREYLTAHIVFELGPREEQGLDLFLNYAEALNLI